MKKMHILLMSFVLISLLILGCGKATNPVDVPLSENSVVSSLAKGSPFAMTDRFATETDASGSGTSDVAGGSIETEVKAEGLIPNHPYELKVSINFIHVATFGGASNNDGEIEFEVDLDLVGIAGPGNHRLDFFFTHNHPTVAGSGATGAFLTGLLARDPLLACLPAQFVTVPEPN